jgi:thiol-disulfide isomerase/thioredoxin
MRMSVAVLVPFVLAAAAIAADVGEKATELEVSAWIQGDPVVMEQCVGKKIVVLEFWATWCDPCKKAIPRIARLAEKYKGKDVEFVAISDEPVDDVKAFMKDGKIKYRVACDKDHNTTGAYMRGNKTLKHAPLAVIVDKKGDIAWQGEANSSLDRVLERAVAGKLDAEKAKSIGEMERTVDESLVTKYYEQAAADADKLLEADPGNDKGLTAKLKLAEKLKDVAMQKEFLDKTMPLIDGDAAALNVVAWQLATAENPLMRQPAVALKAAKRAVDLSESSEAAILDTLALLQSQCGMLDQAIETQKKALALDEKDEDMKAKVEYYQRCAEAKKSAK